MLGSLHRRVYTAHVTLNFLYMSKMSPAKSVGHHPWFKEALPREFLILGNCREIAQHPPTLSVQLQHSLLDARLVPCKEDTTALNSVTPCTSRDTSQCLDFTATGKLQRHTFQGRRLLQAISRTQHRVSSGSGEVGHTRNTCGNARQKPGSGRADPT